MLTITCYHSGALQITDDATGKVHLSHEAANRLIMAARMKSVDDFVSKLANLIPEDNIARGISGLIAQAQGSERWNLKEKFARLPTVVPGHAVENPDGVKEIVRL